MRITRSLYHSFIKRHIGKNNLREMLKTVNSKNIDTLINESINMQSKFKLKNMFDKKEEIALNDLQNIMNKNIKNKTYIGMGYTNSILPSVIKRNILENPKWYTPYTPYQAEISQGRLETQYNYQEIIKSLTGLPISNSSLLDEGSSASEVLNMSYLYHKKKKNIFYCSKDIHPQILNILQTKARVLNINLIIDDFSNIKLCDNTIGILFQYPNTFGNIIVENEIIAEAKDKNIIVSCSADLLSLTKIKSPYELGCDIAFGTAQQLGIPMWYGGPHPSYLSCDNKLLRLLPGRIVGKSLDVTNEEVYRLGLQTREQHIKKEKATSNICTAQALLANVAAFYTIYHGKEGIENISDNIILKTKLISSGLNELGINNLNDNMFNTIRINYDDQIFQILNDNDILLRNINNEYLTITIDEATDIYDCLKLLNIIKKSKNPLLKNYNMFDIERLIEIHPNMESKFLRNSDFLNDEVFNKYTTETDFMRYIYDLSKKDYTLCEGMIPLGSCTMKLNSSFELEPLTWNNLTDIHPYVPNKYAQGYLEMINNLGTHLKNITGFDNVSFQTNSGAMGEYTGLLCIKKYHEELNNDRNICLIPESAHGTNFASAMLANLKIVKFHDNLDDNEFENLVKKYKDNLACLMITYPNTNGVFQKNIKFICDTIHKYDGLVYMDGANMNALVGLTSPSEVGADICHLNLHKTFCIPHGGGGPGMGPILCNNKLKNYLPDIFYDKNDKSVGQITAANNSSASILTIPYLYIEAMGYNGLKKATEIAILNSNYLKEKLKDHYTIVDVNENNRVAHEFIIDLSEFKKYNINEQDIAKRLIDYSFHPGTMSWPRKGVIMFEPTESESQIELDRLVDSLISIRNEIQEVIDGKYDYNNNVLKNSPHPIKFIKEWKFPYDMKKAYYPIENLEKNKFYPSIGRVNDIVGDKNLLKTKN